MATPAEWQNHREQLRAMILELQSNRIILNGLVNYYSVFLFTGGVVPRQPWGLVAITSYLQRPFAADRISTGQAERYRHLAEVVMELGQAIAAGARPRSLRSRHDIAVTFGRVSSEIWALGSRLELAITELLQGVEPSSPLSEMGPTLESVELNSTPIDEVAITSGGEP